MWTRKGIERECSLLVRERRLGLNQARPDLVPVQLELSHACRILWSLRTAGASKDQRIPQCKAQERYEAVGQAAGTRQEESLLVARLQLAAAGRVSQSVSQPVSQSIGELALAHPGQCVQPPHRREILPTVPARARTRPKRAMSNHPNAKARLVLRSKKSPASSRARVRAFPRRKLQRRMELPSSVFRLRFPLSR
jgi:hypothetical protein